MATDACPEKEDAVTTGVTGAVIAIVVTAGGTGVAAVVGGTVCAGEVAGVGDDEEDTHPARHRAAIRIRVRAAPGTGYA